MRGSLLVVAALFSLSDAFWYPIMPFRPQRRGPFGVRLLNRNLVAYRPRADNATLVIHGDACPHQGAALSKGWVNDAGNLQCPYHGFEFCAGRFCRIPDPSTDPPYFASRTCLPTLPSRLDNNYYYVRIGNGTEATDTPPPFFPPEHTDPSFRAVVGERRLPTHPVLLIENLLDMLHISYVHSFGSRVTPLPHKISYHDLDALAGRTLFEYFPNENTISRWVGRREKALVENEFHLPTSTVTRVRVGDVVKTVFTQIIPHDRDHCTLRWTVYRNFWIDPYLEAMSALGDAVIRLLMERTIDEDARILSCIAADRSPQTLQTRYDVTIHHFRIKARRYAPEIFLEDSS